jgi:hypothetical protein
MNNENKQIQSALLENPWRNAYWFARMLINNDKYGGIIGKDNKLLSEICLSLRKVIEDYNQSDEIKMNVAKSVIKNMLDKRFAKRTTKTDRINLFYEDLVRKIKSTEDIAVLILTAESIMIPINEAIKWVPSNDREFTETTAKSYLDELKEAALATVINLWDDAGVEGCLNAERVAVVREFTNLQRRIALLSLPEYEANMVMTAFVQEFERRLGQKRKGRAGGSLEDVTSFLFDYFKIKAEKRPEHFQADIEVDKWIKCKDKWLIGISCKRTLRERWKQVSSASKEILSNFKIREIWHLLTYDEDLSDDKLTLLGSQRHVFYLRDESRRFVHALGHIGMKDYVRPMSRFIEDIRKEQT